MILFLISSSFNSDAMEVVVDEKDAVASTSSPFSSSSNMSGTLSRKKQLVKSPTININKGKKRTIEESGDGYSPSLLTINFLLPFLLLPFASSRSLAFFLDI